MTKPESDDGSQGSTDIEYALKASEGHFRKEFDLLVGVKAEGGAKLDGRQVTTRVMQLVLYAQRIEQLAIDAGKPHDPIKIYRRLQSIYFSGIVGLNYCTDGGRGRYSEERGVFLEGFRVNGQRVVDMTSSRQSPIPLPNGS